MSDPKNIPVSKNWLVGGGELGYLIRNHNWSANPLGPPERWPRSLKTAVRIMLTSRQPMFVWWGRDLINLYNDAYKSIIGGKHPEAFGQPASVVWREIWDQVGPRAESTMVNNEGTYDEALLLIMERHGYQEETYYTFSYSPIPDDQGSPGGIFCANTDDTQRIIGERQLALLRELAARTADARTFDEACTLSARSLETNRVDLPFALIYLADPDHRRVTLAGAAGIGRGHLAAPEKVDLQGEPDDQSVWPFAEALKTHKACLVSDLKPLGPLPSGAWARPPRQAVAVPIAPSGQTGKAGVLILGLNPFRLFDDNYKRFIELVSGQIAASIANAQAYEEEKGRAEALAEIDRTKTAFFSNVSHEFRTPLTLMLGPIEETLADGQSLPPALRERMELLHQNALRLLKLVNTLLDFSRIEAGRVEAVYEPTDAASLTADMVSVFRSALERAGLRLIVDTPPLPEPVYIDREMWEKMVLNLLSNAFKFTFEGEIEVALRWAEDHIELKVRDTGIGIPQGELPRLFERFHRVKGARSRTQEGSGIGLALVQELVRMHGGMIEVESKVGKGTTFTISIPTGAAHLPADRIGTTRTLASTALGAAPYVEEAMRWLPAGSAPSDPERLASEGIDPARMHSDFGGRTIGFRILLADDNTDMREYVRRLLSARWKVEPVADGAAALKRAREHPPDLILSDVMMPGLDGFELLRALRNDPQLKEIPFILLSARAGEESRIEGLEAGADDYLVKPFSARELMARVGAHLELSRLRRETLQNEQKLRAEAERANRFKSEFVSQVSHDLRTPLNAIIGYTELLRGGIYGPIGEEEKPALERIYRNADDLLHLVNNILDLARMESGKLPLDLTPVAMIPLLEDLCLEMKPLIDRKGLSLNCEELAPALPLIVSDPLRIKQVVGNLLTNAVKFTEKGEIKVSARELPTQEEIEIEVSDTGVGITPEALSRVFESFYQAEESRTLGGSGLGLTIVKELVELLKGKIAVRSEYGKGSTFIVSLPYRLEEGKE